MDKKEVVAREGNQVEWTQVSQTLRATILSPERTLYRGEVSSISVPGDKGRFEVLRGHAPILSSLGKGEVRCKGSNPFSITIESGFIEVSHNLVSLCVELP